MSNYLRIKMYCRTMTNRRLLTVVLTLFTGFALVNSESIITWPLGTYGLMQTAHGCPSGTWFSGWRYHDTEDSANGNYFSTNIGHYMKGLFTNDIQTYFCIKNRHSYTVYDKEWGKGAYCLLKYGACPQGFLDGFVYWDDEDSNNKNSYGGTVPEGIYNRDTNISYCCRHDGLPTSPMYLPTEEPFILLRYGSTCQAVHGMMVHTLYIRWDDEDNDNKNSAGGLHPADREDYRNHKLNFCYYYSHY